MHPEIPPIIWRSWCPFRPLKYPEVAAWLIRYGRWQRYQMLPDVGGLDDQSEQLLQAFDLMTWALRQPLLDHGPRRR